VALVSGLSGKRHPSERVGSGSTGPSIEYSRVLFVTSETQ